MRHGEQRSGVRQQMEGHSAVRTYAYHIASISLAPFLCAQEVGFVERYVLADDRQVPLQELVPGTEEHFAWHVLDRQNQGKLAEADALLAQFGERFPQSRRREVLLNRQRLLCYARDGARTLDHIRRVLDLRFDHQREVLPEEQELPSRLPPEMVSRETLAAAALRRAGLNGFRFLEEPVQEYLLGLDLSPDRRRELLQALRWPDNGNVVPLVLADLKRPDSGGFGSLPIHDLLLLPQLDQCAEALPELLGNSDFVQTYMAKLQPASVTDWRNEPAEEDAYLGRLWAFARRLPPTQNSARAHVLFHRLRFDRSRGVYDKSLFLEYAQVPRLLPYMSRAYLRACEAASAPFADLAEDYSEETGLPPVAADEALVRDYLSRFLLEADSVSEFSAWFDEAYLRQVFAETRLLNGRGDAATWFGMLDPAQVRDLRDRVEVDFLPDNPARFGVGDTVRLRLAIKNAPQVLIKTYEINTLNWYLQKGEEITAAADLDGLAPAEERSLSYPQPPILRHIETFEFPSMNRPGVWVVEFIGNGKSSRAVVRKGRLRIAERVGAAGHVFRVYDEGDRPVPDAVAHLGPRVYTADAQGDIVVPFSTEPGEARLVVRQGSFAALHTFVHQSETYELQAAVHVDPESLLTGNRARVLVRTALTVAGVPADPALLEDVTIAVSTTDALGVSSTRPDVRVTLTAARDYVAEFVVPPDLRRVEVSIRGKVEQVSTGKKVDLEASEAFEANTVEASQAPGQLWLRRAADGAWLELIGRGGEPLPRTPVTIHLEPRWFSRPVDVTLATDAQGRVALGDLTEIASVRAECSLAANVVEAPLAALRRRSGWPDEIRMTADEALRLPLDGDGVPDTAVSLVAVSGTGRLAQSVSPAEVAFRDGVAVLAGIPPGEYIARLLPSCRRVSLQVLPGRRVGPAVLARERTATGRPYLPLAIAECSVAEGGLTLRVAGADADTRVHVVANRLLTGPDPADAMLLAAPFPAVTHQDPCEPAHYVSGRRLGDEVRYVLERRHAAPLPGVMLTRPSLLLNPWEVRRTETSEQQAREGEEWADAIRRNAPRAAPQSRKAAASPRPPSEAEVMMTAPLMDMQLQGRPEPKLEPKIEGKGPLAPVLDVLSGPSLALSNLTLDAEGRLAVKLPELGPRQVVTVVVTNGAESVLQQTVLPCPAETWRDLRVDAALDGAARFGEARTVTTLPAAAEVVVGNAFAARVQAYASVADVYALFESMADPAAARDLAEFRFVLDWPELPDERKQDLYSRHACHELNVLLARKDPAFFDRVIRPYLANRRDKTVVDCWLLGAGLEAFLHPWWWQRLNAFERVAIAKALPAHAGAVRRALAEVCALRPRDPAAELDLFLKALQGRGLAGGFDLEGTGGWSGAEGAGAFAAAPPPAPEAAAGPARGEAAEKELLRERAEAAADEVEAMEAVRLSAGADRARRRAARRLYTDLDQTAEWAESNYWKLPLAEQSPDRVPENPFWADWAAHDGKGPFLSTHLAEANSCFTEMMLAMAVLDLPWRSTPAEAVIAEGTLRLPVPGPAVCYLRELKAQEPGTPGEVFVRQEFTDPAAEPERTPYGERQRRVGDLVPAGRPVAWTVMVTNATAEPRHVDVLMQIPEGAVPLGDTLRLRSVPVLLEPYEQHPLQGMFYFPRPGSYRHYPATVSGEGRTLAQAEARSFTVSEKAQTDTGTWDYVSQFGSDDQVLAFLSGHNLREVCPRLERIAFRMRDRAFFGRALDLLRGLHVFDPVLWSYAVLHNDADALREYLPHTPLAEACGPWLDSPLLSVDAARRGTYEHKEYWPLVNARAHALGPRRTILNAAFLDQYHAFLDRLAHKPSLDAEDRLALVVYLALQDRVQEALDQFARVDIAAVAERVQYHAAQAYLLFCQGNWSEARAIARRYEDYPVTRWRDRFRELLAQCAEIAGEEPRVVDREDRTQVQTQLADTEPSLDLSIEGRRVRIRHRNVAEVTVNYYPMDVELLFSRAPFSQDASAVFAVVQPARSDRRATEAAGGELAFDLPEEYAVRNVIVEARAGGLQRSLAYTPNSLDVQMQENYGQLRVVNARGGKPMPAVYVKVYARYRDGGVGFYKDGYTDLRGRFDYASLSTGALERVERFAVLVLSTDAGALVREAAPPRR